MQMLFQWEMSKQDTEKLEAKFWKGAKAAEQTRTFANQLFEGAARDSKALDELISKHSANWRLERLSVIDRAILRLGDFQFIEKFPETPAVFRKIDGLRSCPNNGHAIAL